MKFIELLISRIGFIFYMIWRALIYYLGKYRKWVVLPLILVFILSLKYALFPAYNQGEIDKEQTRKTVHIPRGATLKEISYLLQKENLLDNPQLFILLGKISGYQRDLQAGLFEIPDNLHPWHLLKFLTRPELAEIKVTLPEGIQTEEMAAILASHLDIDSTRFMQLVSDSGFCRSLHVEINHLEGYLLPETYFFTFGLPEENIVERLVGNTLSLFQPDSIQEQMNSLGMTRHEIVTLASIIEGEVVVDSERVLVSSVYHNRLDRGWHLAADPTIQYILPGPPRRLLNRHLEIDSPYNTYKYPGLPPGPINNPGKNSIMAALYPAQTRYLYFVASGDGGHHFSRTAREHAYWKEKFNRIRREVRRNQRNNTK